MAHLPQRAGVFQQLDLFAVIQLCGVDIDGPDEMRIAVLVRHERFDAEGKIDEPFVWLLRRCHRISP
jgi:hypothetical protein